MYTHKINIWYLLLFISIKLWNKYSNTWSIICVICVMHLTKIRVPDPPLVFVKSIFSIYLGDQITPSLTYQTIIKNFLFKNKMLYLASLQKSKSNTSNSVRLLTCYYTPYKLSIFKISPMSECFKVPPYKALLLSWTTCVTVLNLVRRQQQPLFLGWVTPTGYYEDDHASLSEDHRRNIDATHPLTQPNTTTISHLKVKFSKLS